MREMRREIGSRYREAPLWTELRARYSGMVLYFTPTGFSIVSVSLPTSMKQPFTFSPFIWLNLFTLYTSPKLYVHHFKQLQQESPTVSSRESNAAQRLCFNPSLLSTFNHFCPDFFEGRSMAGYMYDLFLIFLSNG